ncbi:MAG: MBL fold metallo-hydrolase [Geobacter sp.]|nr:MAG: MBL fold metallo-hydrolase [Geobacter sp.]
MHRLFSFFIVFVALVFLVSRPSAAANYQFEKVADGVYAAIAAPAGKAASNAMIIITKDQVLLAGAHFSPEGTTELLAEIARLTTLPLRYVILTHHHKGFNHIDFNFPKNVEIVTSWQTWQSLKGEYRELSNPVMFFDKGLTLQRNGVSIVLSNTGFGHSRGDVFIYMPGPGVLFTSDLVYNDVIGYMGDGDLREWAVILEILGSLDARTVIPGLGKVTDSSGIQRFTRFYRDFTTEVLRYVEKGATLAQLKKNFRLADYEHLPGYKTFRDVNLERAYQELKEK